MASNLSDLRPYLRTLLFDNQGTQTYSNAEVDDFLRVGFWIFYIDSNGDYTMDSSDVITPTMDKQHQVIVALAAMLRFAEAKVANDGFITARRFKDDEIEQDYTIGASVLKDYLGQLRQDYLRLIANNDSDTFEGALIQTTFNTDEATLRYTDSSVVVGAFG